MYGVLILGFLFWFVVPYPKPMCKSLEIFFLEILGAPRKKQRCCFFRDVPCAQHFETITCTGYSHSRLIVFFFSKLLVLHWKSSNIAPFMEHPVYIIFKVENALNLACWFSYDTSYPNSMFKTCLFLNFACSLKEASIFFLLWSTLYKVFSMYKVAWFLIIDFTLSLVTQTPCVKRFYSQSSRCSAKETTILTGHPEKWPESWLILICHCLQGFLM